MQLSETFLTNGGDYSVIRLLVIFVSRKCMMRQISVLGFLKLQLIIAVSVLSPSEAPQKIVCSDADHSH